MKVQNVQTYNNTSQIQVKPANVQPAHTRYFTAGNYISSKPANVSFGANPFKEIDNIKKFLHAKFAVKSIKKYIEKTNQQDNFLLRH